MFASQYYQPIYLNLMLILVLLQLFVLYGQSIYTLRKGNSTTWVALILTLFLFDTFWSSA